MRKTKTIKIDDREITIKELRVKDIRKLLETAENVETFSPEQVSELLSLTADIPPDALEDMAPSEIKALWEGFREVNSDFLAAIERLGIAEALKGFLRTHLTGALADLSSGGTAASGTTAGGSL